MKLTKEVEKILSHYESDSPGTKTNIARILMNGKLGGTGKLLILPVDQGFEHGPASSFAANPSAYDPHYHFSLAIEAGLSAYAAPLGMLEVGADKFAGCIPTILKVNSNNALTCSSEAPYQAITGSVHDALRLGCSAIGFTIYPGSSAASDMISQISELTREAKNVGLAVVVWSYPRGDHITKKGESSIDLVAYAAHIAALTGAHIIKVKPPIDFIEREVSKAVYKENNIQTDSLAKRVSHVKEVCFAGKRLVVFSGGGSKDLNELYEEVKAIRDGGGNGSIIGRNTFQRPREEALKMLQSVIDIYNNKI